MRARPAMDQRVDGAWVAALANSRVGRNLANHLASVEARRGASAHDCAAQEVLANERVFVHALSRSVQNHRPFPCGLTPQLPQFIAIINLSGERSLVYSDNPALIRSLCSRSSVLHQSELEQRLLLFETYPPSRTSEEMKFVLLSYSLPWQSGTGAAFWHLSACSVNTTVNGMERILVDRRPQFTSSSAAPFCGKSVLDARDSQLSLYVSSPGVLELVSDKQIADFSESYSATCLDRIPTLEGVSGTGGNAQMHSLNQALVKERAKDQAELRRLKAQLKQLEVAIGTVAEETTAREKQTIDNHKMEVDKAHKDGQELVDVAREQYEALCLEMSGLETNQRDVAKDLRKTRKVHDALATKHAEAERQSAAKDALHNAALSKHIATISRLEGIVATNNEKTATALSEVKKEQEARLERVSTLHAEAMAKVVGALESKKRIIDQLSVVNDHRDVEVASLKTHEEEQARRVAALEAKVLATAAPLAPKTHTVSTGTRKTASTSTHHCASTQTAIWKEASVPTVGAKVIENAPSAPPCYQSAINVLQGLVTLSGHAPPPAMVPPHPGYARPLPFPHFTPQNMYHYDSHGHGYAPPTYAHQKFHPSY